MRLSPDKDTQSCVELALSAGWDVTHDSGGHVRFRSPSGATYTTAQTPRVPGTVRALRRNLRVLGLEEAERWFTGKRRVKYHAPESPTFAGRQRVCTHAFTTPACPVCDPNQKAENIRYGRTLRERGRVAALMAEAPA